MTRRYQYGGTGENVWELAAAGAERSSAARPQMQFARRRASLCASRGRAGILLACRGFDPLRTGRPRSTPPIPPRTPRGGRRPPLHPWGIIGSKFLFRVFAVEGPAERVGGDIFADLIEFSGIANDMLVVISLP